MATYNAIQQFTEDLCKGVHDLSADALTIGLTSYAERPVATDAVLADINPISYANLTANGAGGGDSRVCTITSCEQSSGTTKLILVDLTFTCAGACDDFAEIFLFNDTPTSPANPLICWWEYSTTDLQMASGETFTIDFDGTNGVMQVAPAA